MDLWLYLILILISLVFIFLCFYAPEHSELGIVGFLFLFLLSLVMLGGDIQYKVGVNTTTTTTYEYENLTETPDTTAQYLLISTSEARADVDVYETFTAGGTLSHTVGFYMAIASIVGFIGVLVGLRSQFKRRDEED